MTRWFTSDLHFGHRNVIEYCDRPYKDIYEMDPAIVKQWNSQVKPEDEVYFLGDFGINKKKVFDKDLLDQLNGTKHIILGNHDFGFSRLHNQKQWESISNKYFAAGWASVGVDVHFFTLKNGLDVHLSHLPPSNDHDNRYSQFKQDYHEDDIYLHGHLHGHYRKKKNMIDVCFDGDLKLLSEDELISIIEDSRDFIPTRLTEKYGKDVCLMLMPFEEEVKKKNLRSTSHDNLILYNYTDQCTYDRAWNDVTRHSRGIIFERETGKIVALPFPKFFNVGEMPETRLENLPDESYVVTKKMDGSLGIIYNYNGKWNVATRGSFNSVQAQRAEQILKKYDMSGVYENLTLLVEIIYPENKIVANYGDDEKLVLLAMANRDTQKEQTRIQCQMISKSTGMPLVEEYNHTIEEMIELQKTLPKDEEGFVVRFESGLRVKIKGEEYLRIHKMISHMTPIAFWESMKKGKVDIDYLQELPEEYRIEAERITKKLEDRFANVRGEILWECDTIIRKIGLGSIHDREYRKQVGLEVNSGKYKHTGAIFHAFLNKDQALEHYMMKAIRPNNNLL